VCLELREKYALTPTDAVNSETGAIMRQPNGASPPIPMPERTGKPAHRATAKD
jgi:hypothetical protein